MDLHNLPNDVGLDRPDPNMGASESLFGTFESEPSPLPNLTCTNPSKAEIAEEHDARSMSNTEGLGGASAETVPDEQPSKYGGLLSPHHDRIQTLYDTYHTSYAFPISETSAHMQHAKDLAVALLQRHFPEPQGYLVEPATLGPYSAYGINFIFKCSNEPDSDPDTPPAKKQKRPAKRTDSHYPSHPSWHHIERENMDAFVIKKSVVEVRDGVEIVTYRPHTYLVIVLDDLSTFQRWSRANVNHRGDVLSDLLGVFSDVEKGRGMLFFGPRLEMYNFDASNDATPVSPHLKQHWRMDMRTTSLATIDEALRSFAAQEVVYQDMH